MFGHSRLTTRPRLSCQNPPEHPFFVAQPADTQPRPAPEGHRDLSRNWVGAGHLKIGDTIKQADGTTGLVANVTTVGQTREMFNLTVSEAHTYYVGQDGWLIHNGGKIGCGEFFNNYGTQNGGIQAQVVNGVLKLAVKKAPGTPSGREMFEEAWGQLGSKVQQIEGYWMPGGDMADNFVSFNNALATGLSPEQAAMQTWTGKMAASKGFTQVIRVEVGERGVIQVLFGKPR
ncbi:polymorphic toxin-type HINT domain-containing protein [Deinococcus yunweiensis]|uniref:polymorphic toxin-type HINT domain-containing protein n=1 Tax=Deinococcus yunweiensis TaxID=367282 RepID=UPI00398EF929